MHIGLIGGIGPAATVVYYQRLCARMRQLGAPLELTIVQADVNTLITNNLADRRNDQAAIYAELIDRLKAAGAQCVGITSLGGHLYGQLHRTKAVACDDDIERLGQMYQDVAVTGVCTELQRAAFFDAGRRMVEEQGADAIVLAGTELGLAFDGRETGYRVIDALDVHVSLLADVAAGRTSLRVP